MTEETTENANDSAASGSRQERVVSRLLELEQHIRKEADFNSALAFCPLNKPKRRTKWLVNARC